MERTIKLFKKEKIGKILLDESIKKYNTYKIGGKASIVVFPKNVEKLITTLKILQSNNIKYKVIGKGSNLIFSDKHYKGCLIKLDELNDLEIEDTVVRVGAGYSLMKLAFELTKRGLSGLEFATGIPGSVGGAIFMNAGAYKSDMGYVVSEIKILDENFKVKTLYNSELNFHYRTSYLQNHKDCICLEATLVLKHGNKKEMLAIVEDRRRRRLLSQPLEYPSAGSVFRNPDNIPAGKLIEDLGLKGKMIGGAMISRKHANFIINYNEATGNDIFNLINLVKNEVYKKNNITLKEEQEFVNWE